MKEEGRMTRGKRKIKNKKILELGKKRRRRRKRRNRGRGREK